ncbi:TIGR01244 family sulfur transferase [Qipengyuania oceanensis]|uniref:TIGR01244 family sulfur transferase n=1 Tax=Qipengyuania oceanensis TaxID=1463597 RepID=UPI001F1A278B|nr:TIGR01244 family sulfur transferase [Qipengyuania oceanensis]
MKLAHVSDAFAVSPQLEPNDMRGLADAGFSTVICNRPDDEELSQPTVASMREAAEAAGLAFHHIPVSGGEFPPVAIKAFAKVREEADGKVLAFCRTGTRSITLDALANIEHESAAERINRAKIAGYDLSGLRDRLGE